MQACCTPRQMTVLFQSPAALCYLHRLRRMTRCRTFAILSSSFSKMTPKQRTRYLKFLSDPTTRRLKSGTFLFFTMAWNAVSGTTRSPAGRGGYSEIVLAHDHAGFRGYAANTLIYICSKCGLMTSIQVPVQSYADALPLVYLQAKLSSVSSRSYIDRIFRCVGVFQPTLHQTIFRSFPQRTGSCFDFSVWFSGSSSGGVLR